MPWEAPKRPFDLEAYLKGNESWTGGKPLRRAVNSITARPRLEHSKSSSREPSRPEHDVRAEARPADQVPEVPVDATKKIFLVPRAPPGVQFYRLKTKRPIHEGEPLSESDDDIDEEWLHQLHADTLAALPGATRVEREFLQRFDRHMLTEAPASYDHTAETLVRFCRQNRAWLRRPDVRFEFVKKTAALKLQGRLSWTTIRECKRIIDDKVAKDEDGGEPMDVDAPALDEAPERPESPIQHHLGQCARCHEVIRHMRALQTCAFPGCPRPKYHLRCLGLEARKPAWVCAQNKCRVNAAYQKRSRVARKSTGGQKMVTGRDSDDDDEAEEPARRRESTATEARPDRRERNGRREGVEPSPGRAHTEQETRRERTAQEAQRESTAQEPRRERTAQEAQRESRAQEPRRERTTQEARRESPRQRVRREDAGPPARRESAELEFRRQSPRQPPGREAMEIRAPEMRAPEREEESTRNGMDVDRAEPARPTEPLDVHAIQDSLESEMRARAAGAKGMFPNLKRANRAV